MEKGQVPTTEETPDEGVYDIAKGKKLLRFNLWATKNKGWFAEARQFDSPDKGKDNLLAVAESCPGPFSALEEVFAKISG